MNKTLVVDIGGTRVKLMLEGAAQRMFDSGARMEPNEFVARLRENSGGWTLDNISIGFPGIERLGEEEWKREVIFAVTQLKKSFIADYVVLGGGNVHRFDQLPEGIEHGKNENAFLGGLRLWETDSRTGERKWQIF